MSKKTLVMFAVSPLSMAYPRKSYFPAGFVLSRRLMTPINFYWFPLLLSLSILQAQPQPPAQAGKPLPDLEDFLKGVRSHLRSDRLLLSQYTYTEKDLIHELDKKGNIKSGHELVYEVYPSLEEGLSYRRLMSRDGKPTGKKDQDKQDRQHDKKLMEPKRALEREGTDERARRLAKEAEENQNTYPPSPRATMSSASSNR
ncbi:MAG: hypothetical protein LAP85_22680 [Acidobacteriia bacterium]|nr:hypothetical protein [Terriglobia bacterium]